jgi:hypothetical protein
MEAITITGYWYLPPLLGALPLGFNFKSSLKLSLKIYECFRIRYRTLFHFYLKKNRLEFQFGSHIVEDFEVP